MGWLLGDGTPAHAAYARRVLDALQWHQAVVPGIWALEAANVIARAHGRALVDEARVQAFVLTLHRLPIATDPATATQALSHTLRLARSHSLSAYDAAYLELALREGLPLASLDAALLRAAGQAGIAQFAA